MSQAMLPLVMMMVLSSSSAVGAFLMMGGEEDDGTGGANNQNDDQNDDQNEDEDEDDSEPEPEHCQGSWSTAACSATCGGGTKTKTWTTTRLPQYGGRACPSPTTKTLPCNSQPCSVAQAPAGATS